MEEERISSTGTTIEGSESNGSNFPRQRPNTAKRPNKPNGGGSTGFKGVVYQKNGHWGAQIYANHRRVSLGTFKTEAIAAAAYDSAAIKLRHGIAGESHRNFPWTALTRYEPEFQAQYETQQVLNMIKDGSYQTKFSKYISSIFQMNNPSHYTNNQEGYLGQELFRKELTPSDVSKLNRLVIPKRYAQQYLPAIDTDKGGDGMKLKFYDKTMRKWNFRYCYWKSSQSYVFTRGWNKFVKVMELEAKDIVTFYMCEFRQKCGENANKQFWMIDIVKANRNWDGGIDYGNEMNRQKTLWVEEAEKARAKKDKGFRLFSVQVYGNETKRQKTLRVEEEEAQTKKEEGFRLFGVQMVPSN